MLRPASLLMVGRMVGFAATFFVPLILVRVLDQAQFGTYKQLFLVFGTLFPLAQLGMAESLYYFLPTAKERTGRYVGNALIVLAGAGGLGLVGLTLASDQVAVWLNNSALASYLPLIGVYLFLILVAAVLEITLIARERYGLAATSYAASDVVKALLLVLPVVFFGSLRWLLYGAIAFAALRAIVTLGFLRGRLGGGLRPAGDVIREQVAYTAPFQLAVVLEILGANAHFYAVSWSFDAATYAIYAVGCLNIPITDFISSSVGNVMMVKLRAAAAEENLARVLQIWKETTRKLALVLFPITALLLLCADDLVVLLFTADYRAAVPVLMVWSLFIALSVVDTDAVLRVYAETRFLAIVNGVCLVVTLALVGWLMGALGLVGAVVATLIASAIAQGIAVWRFGHVLGVSLRQLLPWGELAKVAALTAASAVPVLVLRRPLELTSLQSLLLIGSSYSAIYAGAAFIGGLRAGERAALLAPLRRFSPLSPKFQALGED